MSSKHNAGRSRDKAPKEKAQIYISIEDLCKKLGLQSSPEYGRRIKDINDSNSVRRKPKGQR